MDNEEVFPFVYLPDEQTIGQIIYYGAHCSRVVYVKDGITYNTVVLNEDFFPIERAFFEYESDDNEV